MIAESEELHIERFTLAIALNQEEEVEAEATEELETQEEFLEEPAEEVVEEIDL